MSAGARPLRVLLHKPLRRVSEPYFRVRQYVAALERLGHRPELLDFGRLRGSAARRLFGVLGQLAVSARAFTRHDVIVLTPHPLVALYGLLARLLGRWVILDQTLTHSETLRREVVYPVLDLALFSRRYDAEADALRRSLGIKDRFVVSPKDGEPNRSRDLRHTSP